MQRQPGICVAAFFLGIAILCSCSVSAAILPTATYLISFEQNGTPACTYADFSLACYGHSFLNTAMDTQYLNTTTENPVPLSRVLDVQVSCNPFSCCRASSHDAGDPERIEWCELNGTTTEGEIVRTTIPPENVIVNCSGRKYETQYRRCLAEADAKTRCFSFSGSRQLRCFDAQHEEILKCLAAFDESIAQSPDLKNYSGISKVCEIRFNSTAFDPFRTGTEEPRPDTLPMQSGATTPRTIAESLWCGIQGFFGVRC